MGHSAAYFDGQDSTRWPVEVTVEGRDLLIRKQAPPASDAGPSDTPGPPIRWSRGSYRQVHGTLEREHLRFERGLEALVTKDRQLLLLLGRRPLYYNQALLWTGGVTLLALVGGYVFGLPALAREVAQRMPISWEQKLGQQSLTQIAPVDQRCADPAANAALTRIADRLAAARPPLPYPVKITLAKDPQVNAFAIPGGYLIVNTGLLQRTQTPGELAGILAHEIEHVRHRHPTQGVVRALSKSALLSIAAGDFTSLLGMATTLSELRYQRGDETQADEDGMRRMAAAGIDPAGMIAAFHMLERVGIELPARARFLSSHPLTRDRIAGLEALSRTLPYAAGPAVYDGHWSVIASACEKPGDPAHK